MKQAEKLYQSFLVRCWLIPPADIGEAPNWRFELLGVTADSQKYRFSDLTLLEAFMSAKLAAAAASFDGDTVEDAGRTGGHL